MRTLIIVNPHAAGGRARKVFDRIEDQIAEKLGEVVVAITEKPEDVAEKIDAAASAGIDRVIAIGGDGTNHVVLNTLVQRPDLTVSFGSLPVGTGRDWARSLGVPADPHEAVDWLARAQSVPCDLGKMEYVDTSCGDQLKSQIFLNIASAGVSGEVDARVNRARRRTSFTFLGATIKTLFQYKPQRVTVTCDGAKFYEGSSYLLVVANGRCFGRGMWVAPHALVNDGLFDVVLVEGMPLLRILFALQTVFSGKHLKRSDVHHTRASVVGVYSEDGPLSLDLDGEEAQGQDLSLTVLPGAVNMLLDPASNAVKSP